ncbi:hypothetical protein M0Q50_10185 [bacterium]|nr:hypothetical protein [bacterium]
MKTTYNRYKKHKEEIEKPSEEYIEKKFKEIIYFDSLKIKFNFIDNDNLLLFTSDSYKQYDYIFCLSKNKNVVGHSDSNSFQIVLNGDLWDKITEYVGFVNVRQLFEKLFGFDYSLAWGNSRFNSTIII